jgi:hypothetical protein
MRDMCSDREFVSNLLERQRELGVLWSEGRYSNRAFLEILELFCSEHQEHPELTDPSLYEAVVARSLGPYGTNARIRLCGGPRIASGVAGRVAPEISGMSSPIFDEYLRSDDTRRGPARR